jgi:hypothetical protein
MRQMILNDVRPETNIEWLWVLDRVDLLWKILRYRGLKQKILEEFRVIAVESLLRRLDGSGITEEGARSLPSLARHGSQNGIRPSHCIAMPPARYSGVSR